MDEATKEGRAEVTKTSVIEVALAHHLVSQYTSLVAVDVTPARPTDVPGAEPGQTTNLANMQLSALPKTATGWQLQLLLGLSALVLAALVRRLRNEVA